jgi:hypothetical protein
MATKKKVTRKKRYSCGKRSCPFRAGTPSGVREHYRDNPSHRPHGSDLKAKQRRESYRRKRLKQLYTPAPVSALPTTAKNPVAPTQKYCTECGGKIGHDWKFCGFCGTPMRRRSR